MNHEISAAELRLRDGAVAPLFRKYAIPGVVTLLFVGLQTIIDGIVLGNCVGANALASVSLVLPCYSFVVALAIVMGVGCQTLVSICLGERDGQGANDAFSSAFWFLVGFSFLASLGVYVFAPAIAFALGANEVLLSGSVDYLRALIPFFPLIVGMFFSDYVLKSIGRPVYAMCVMSATVVLNLVLDLVFIALWDMGTMGAGLATGIAFGVGAMFNLPVILGKGNLVSLSGGCYRWPLVWKMMYNGSSEGMSELSAGVSTLLFNLALMRYLGESGVAAFTALNYVLFIGITVFLGVSDGVIPIISYNFGAGQWSRIGQVFLMALKSNVVIGFVIFLLLFFFGETVISLFFRSGETRVMEIASHGTAIFAFAFLLNGFNILSASYFTALGNAKVSIIISMLRGLIFIAIGIYVLPELMGIQGVWYAVPLAEILTFLVAVVLVRRSFKYRHG